jgi:hypothetical protein
MCVNEEWSVVSRQWTVAGKEIFSISHLSFLIFHCRQQKTIVRITNLGSVREQMSPRSPLSNGKLEMTNEKWKMLSFFR